MRISDWSSDVCSSDLMQTYLHFDSDDFPVTQFGDLRALAAINKAARQMPAEIHDLRPRQFLDELFKPRPDAGQADDRRKKWKEDLRTHRRTQARALRK